jgi:hypothetical protein
MYKLPGFGDVPVSFNVHMLKVHCLGIALNAGLVRVLRACLCVCCRLFQDKPNPRAIYSSKAVGESTQESLDAVAWF